jgi:hypothetical protein
MPDPSLPLGPSPPGLEGLEKPWISEAQRTRARRKRIELSELVERECRIGDPWELHPVASAATSDEAKDTICRAVAPWLLGLGDPLMQA